MNLKDEYADLPALIDPSPSPPQNGNTYVNNSTSKNTTTTTTTTASNLSNNFTIDESMMEDYLAMGFGEDQVRRALFKFRGRLSQCIFFILIIFNYIKLYYFII